MRKEKSGFTLIELLAVIIILAIIALIITPMITEIIKSVRLEANKRSVEGHISNIEYAIMADVLNVKDIGYLDGTKTYDELNLTLPGNDNIMCKSYIIKNGNVLNAFDCNTKNQEWALDVDYSTDKDVIADLKVQKDISYVDSLNSFSNPDRGLYDPVYATLDMYTKKFRYLDEIERVAASAYSSDMSLIHLRVDIAELSGNANLDGIDKPFTQDQLDDLNNVFNSIRRYGRKVIVRFAYDYAGTGGKQPKSFDTVLNHIRQLKDIFEENEDMITCVEAGFLGYWGEMHNAEQYQSDEYYKALIEELLLNTPSTMTINVRTPHHYKIVFDSFDNNNQNKYRVGIFNDGYLGNAWDMATFDSETTRDDFINWMNVQGTHTFYGGEVTKFNTTDASYNVGDEVWSDGEYAAYEMPLTHTSYISSRFNLKILDDKWKNQTYTNESDEYNNQNYYKYIIDHLGYRFVLRNSLLSETVKQGEVSYAEIVLENVGFTNIINPQDTYLILKKDNTYYETKLDINVSDIKSNSKKYIKLAFTIPSDCETGEWDVYFKIANKFNSSYAIRFANPEIYNEDIMANKIGKINIEEGSITGVAFRQANSSSASNGVKKDVTANIVYIPAKVTYYIMSNGEQISQQQVNIIRGNNIDFTNQAQLEQLGIVIPSGYTNPRVSSVLNGWDVTYDIDIPNQKEDTLYWLNVYVDAE